MQAINSQKGTNPQSENRIALFLLVFTFDADDISTKYSVCLVLPAEKGQLTDVGKNCLKTLTLNGLDVLSYQSIDKTEIFVLIGASIEVLRNYADDVNFSMLLDSEILEDMARKGYPEKNISGTEISHMVDESAVPPYEYIYGKYSLRMPPHLYKSLPSEETPFDCTTRAKLINQLVRKKPPSHPKLPIAEYLSKGTVKCYFALHSVPELARLKKNWLHYPIISWRQPFELLRHYLGEKATLYFLFLGHYCKWCALACIVGIPLQAAVFIMNDYSAPFLPFFSYFVALWGIMMLEFWKRSQAEYAMKWGTLGCETTEVDRSDFNGVPIKSFIDGRDMMYFPTKLRRRFVRQSLVGISIMIALVLGAVASIYVLRFALQPYLGANAQTVASIINAVQIQVANVLYNTLAEKLNNRENHRTETEHEDALIAKVFLFEFVNNYASFFYLAFIAELLHDCPAKELGGCMFPLTTNLAIIFASRTIVGNSLALILPVLNVRRRRHQTNKRAKEAGYTKDEISRPEAEYTLEPLDGRSASIADFTELAIQFGYASMFASALPMAPLLSLCSCMISNICSACKLLYLQQRPFPTSAEDIGTWQAVFTMVSVASVITNSSLTVFTMTVTNTFTDFTRFWIYIGFQWTCFTIQIIIMESIPDIPDSVVIQQQRQEFLVSKIIDQIEDDEIDTADTTVREEFAILPSLPTRLEAINGSGSAGTKEEEVNEQAPLVAHSTQQQQQQQQPQNEQQAKYVPSSSAKLAGGENPQPQQKGDTDIV